MKVNLVYLVIFLLPLSCQHADTASNKEIAKQLIVTTDDYQLYHSNNDQALLVLFPGGGTTSVQTKADFDILDKAKSKGVSLLLMNFNRHMWIDESDSKNLADILLHAIENHRLNRDKIFIGGMSIGGTVALTLSNYLVKTKHAIEPKGAFIIDSPIDLMAIYNSSQKDANNPEFSEQRKAEPKWIIGFFEEAFGSEAELLDNVQKVAPITLQTENLSNIEALKDKKIRFYTEPDTLWWKENRETDFESTNAYVLQQANTLMQKNNWSNIQLIQTKNKGYRANGERHPHSWSIVDQDQLIQWILE